MSFFFQTNKIGSYIKKFPGSSMLYNGIEWYHRFWSPKKCIHPS